MSYPSGRYFRIDERKELLLYVEKGGTLLVIGPKAVDNFKVALGVTLGDVKKGSIHFGSSGLITSTTTDYRTFTPDKTTELFGGAYNARDLRNGLGPAATIATYGKGKIAAVYVGLADAYLKNESYQARRFVGELVQKLFTPKVQVTGSQFVHVAINEKDGKTLVNLLNVAGPHKSAASFDEVPVLGPLKVTLNHPRRPTRLTLQPEGKSLSYEYTNGQIVFSLENLHLHSIVEVD